MTLNMNPLLLTDWYKVGHPFQYPEGTEYVYSNMTARNSRMNGVTHMVVFGMQYFIKKYLVEYFDDNFFNQDRDEVLYQYKRRIKTSLGADLPSYDHIEALYDLGYLPVMIKALPEGSVVPMRIPFITIQNTLPEFYWLTNFLETLMSSVLWQPCTSATIAYEYRKLLNHYAKATGMPMEFVQWQGHDFSFRGMSSPESAITSGMGHLLSFTGTDTIPAIDALEQFYNADADLELIGGSVPATEHSVMSAGTFDGELETYRRLLTEIYPSGIVSIVSDTWNLWDVITKHLVTLKDVILSREGKLVVRPDSGNPVHILCGNPAGQTEEERKGVIELLWDIFGGTLTSTGHKLLDSHIGAIYGDSITLARAEEICHRLMMKGFASQCVYGIGSYTYQFNTRDTFGTAIKATYVVIDGEGRPIYKKPVTDDGIKNSAKGLLMVTKDDAGEFVLLEDVSVLDEMEGELQIVFVDGTLVNETSLSEIRARLLG